MWTEVYFSQNADKVKRLVSSLSEARIISRVRGQGEGEGRSYTVLVPRAELDDAQNIIVESDIF